MNMIGHQHAGVYDAAIALWMMLDPIKVGDTVACVAKYIAPVITPTITWYKAPSNSTLGLRHYLLVSPGTPIKSITHASPKSVASAKIRKIRNDRI
jgi:hypothetical protein